jgi:4-hydroxy-3-methylbut-2-enyl diphosphate reductase
VILIGHAGHPEVEGTMGRFDTSFGGKMHLIESVSHVDALTVHDPERLAFVTQTTLSVDDTAEIVTALRTRFPSLATPRKEDICYATQNRQEAVRLLAREADVVLVLGSQNSSNSQRLAELAGESGVSAYLVDGAADIDLTWFKPDDTVLVTAGASAPESVVEDCLEFLKTHFGATVESRSIREEEVYFPLPRELRQAMKTADTTARQ